MAIEVNVKRVREPAAVSDGYRVLVDRLWPRGVSQQAAHLDEWARELAPSDHLRRWFGHRPERFGEFRARYLAELRDQREALRELRGRARKGAVTLLYAAREGEHNNAVVLAEVLRRGLR